ncbi:MAG: hypothetical protein IJ632_08540 [Muribaculaceae bacterium]|nr:hypothetical protein [Muribaculaceae bacterium]
MKNSLFILLLLTAATVYAQNAASQDYSLETLASWNNIEAKGDLNKDGINDWVMISHPPYKMKDEDGDEYSQPVLTICWGNGDGSFTIFRQYRDVMPVSYGDDVVLEWTVDITPRGVLNIGVSSFATAGSWETWQETNVLRYQNGDFFLIGKEESSLMRNTGKKVDTSTNYLTGKRCTTTGNEFDRSVTPRSVWTRLPKGDLKKLGTWQLGQ